MTWDDILTHCLRMAEREPAYALKALRWYSGKLDAPWLVAEYERLNNAKPPGALGGN